MNLRQRDSNCKNAEDLRYIAEPRRLGAHVCENCVDLEYCSDTNNSSCKEQPNVRKQTL